MFLRMVLNYQEGENNIKNIENYIFSLKNFGYIEIADFLEENLQLLLYKRSLEMLRLLFINKHTK